MELETDRLILRRWKETDAESLYEFASDPSVGPIAGWPPHKNKEESLNVIQNVFTGCECYAICEKGTDKAIGCIELKMRGHTDMTDKNDECELGYWLGKPFWGRGYMPEVASKLLYHGFENLGMSTIWCSYYDGNNKSKRVQDKLGFIYHHTCQDVEVPLMNEIRVGHTNYMTKDMWKQRMKGRISMNEIIKNIKTRRSIKKYKGDAVPQEMIDMIVEAGTYAPSGRNKQSSIILEVTDKTMRDQLSRINAQVAGVPEGTDLFYNAPVVLVVLANKDIPTYIYDGSVVMENMMLAAHSLGLGSCWIHRAKETFETDEGKQILKDLGVEGHYEGIGNCIIGYADIEPETQERKENYIYKIENSDKKEL